MTRSRNEAVWYFVLMFVVCVLGSGIIQKVMGPGDRSLMPFIVWGIVLGLVWGRIWKATFAKLFDPPKKED